MTINKLEEGTLLKNNKEFYEVLFVTKNGLIAKIQNVDTGKTSSHTVTEISKNFKTIEGDSIKDLHTSELERMRYKV